MTVFASATAEAGMLREFFEWAGKSYTDRQVTKQAAREAAERRATRAAAERAAAREAAEQRAIRATAERQAVRKQADRGAARRVSERTAARTYRAQQLAALTKTGRKITVGTMTLGSGVLVGQMAQAGYQPNPIPFEHAAVLREMVLLLSEKKKAERASTETLYRTQTCSHPETGEHYVVPQWVKNCPDGTLPKAGQPIVLSGLTGEE